MIKQQETQFYSKAAGNLQQAITCLTHEVAKPDGVAASWGHEAGSSGQAVVKLDDAVGRLKPAVGGLKEELGFWNQAAGYWTDAGGYLKDATDFLADAVGFRNHLKKGSDNLAGSQGGLSKTKRDLPGRFELDLPFRRSFC